METFYQTIQIVFGILLPIIIVISAICVVIIAKSIPSLLEIKLEELKKKPPYDNVEIETHVIDNCISVRFIKNDTVIWQDNNVKVGGDTN